MWDEDPRFHEASWRLFKRLFAVGALWATAVAVWNRDWNSLRYWLTGLVVLGGALGAYAALVGLAGWSVRLTVRGFRWSRRIGPGHTGRNDHC